MKDQILYDKTLGKNLPLLLRSRVKICPDETLQAVKNEDGQFDTYSYHRVYTRVVELACALKKLGVKRHDLVGLVSDNRREWLVTDMALLSLGAADVPRGCDSMGAEIRLILKLTGCKIAFFENPRQLEKILEDPADVPPIEHAVLFDSAEKNLCNRAAQYGIVVHKYIDLEDEGKHAADSERTFVENEMDATEGTELATVIFTSGTTGTPKGVMLSHDNYIAQCEVFKYTLRYTKQGDMWLSVLPVWHSFERVFNYAIMALNSGMAYSKPSASVMFSDMAIIRPQWMCAVPRLWESCAKGFFRVMKKKGKIPYFVFSLALTVGTAFHWAVDRVFGLRCRYKNTFRFVETLATIVPYILLWPVNGLCELLVFRKLRAMFGGKMVAAISGGGSLQPEIDAFYTAIGFKLLEGYGITEAAPVLSVRDPARPRTGCVGKIFASAEVKVVAERDGEIASPEPLGPGKRGLILARGRQIMKGYYKRDDLTAQVIDRDGWLNTGDLGMLTQDGEIKIVGRAKDTIVLLGGENIEPAVIEKAVCTSKFIETAVLVGQDRKFIAALIVPARDNVLEYANENRLVYETYEALLESSELQRLIREEIDERVCAKNGFRACERIFKFTLLGESFQVGREMNSKMEIMRYKVAKIYAHEIKAMYQKNAE